MTDDSQLSRRAFLVSSALAGASLAAGCASDKAAQGAEVSNTMQKQVKRVLILGAGFGGLETATGLAAVLGDGYEITLIDKSDSFFIGFSKIDVLFARKTEGEVRYRYADLRAEGVKFVQDTITAIDAQAQTVQTATGEFAYDYLVVGLGADMAPEATKGFLESGGHEFYTMAGASRLANVIAGFTSGTLAIGVLATPYKCPPAPYEVACQLHDFFVERGVRDDITLKMVIPKPRPVPNPKVSQMLEDQLAQRKIELVAATPITSIDPTGKRIMSESKAVDFDLFVGVPVHVPPAVVRASALSDGGFVAVDQQTLQTAIPNVYAIGDVTKIPVAEKAVPKAGAFAEDAAKTVVSDILRKEGVDTDFVPFRARGACYFELGDGAVAKIDANYLGGEKPKVVVEGPSNAFRPDKHDFVSTRRARWFK